MPLSALTPVERRRRRRRLRRLRCPPALLALVAALAVAGAAAWHWWPDGASSSAAPAPRRPGPQVTRVPSAVHAARSATARRVTAQTLVVARRQPVARIVPALTSRTAILIDGNTGDVLFWQKPHARVPIASVTKVMTALLALEKLKPHDLVTVTAEATRVAPNKEGLRAGEQVEAWKLLYACMLYSGNDSALALAHAVAGSRARFVALMNARARQLELRDTHFSSVSGVVDADNYSSAWDTAALARYAMGNARFRTIVATRRMRVTWAPPINWKLYVNHDRLLEQYPGVDGIKTGWTSVARHTLVTSARRGKVWLIGVTLGSADSFSDMKRLLDLGFRLRAT